VQTALAHLAEDETTFLHAPGLCAECDAARATLSRARELQRRR
jgi:hypothetical protein